MSIGQATVRTIEEGVNLVDYVDPLAGTDA